MRRERLLADAQKDDLHVVPSPVHCKSSPFASSSHFKPPRMLTYGSQGRYVALMLTTCIVLLTVGYQLVGFRSGAHDKINRHDGPYRQLAADKFSERDAKRAQTAHQKAVEHRKMVEKTAMRKDHLVTLLYQQRHNMTVDAFELALKTIRSEVRSAEKAVDDARASEELLLHQRDTTVRSVRETRALAELQKYLLWAGQHIDGYGVRDVCRSVPKDDDRSASSVQRAQLTTEGVTFSEQMGNRPSSCHAEVPFLHAKRDLVVDDISGLTPLDPAVTCELMILGIETCDVFMGTYADCLLWYGTDAWTLALQPQCSASNFWRRATAELYRMYGLAARVGVARFRRGGRGITQNASWATKNDILDKIVRAAVREPASPLVNERWGRVEATHYAPPLACRVRDSVHRVFPFSYGITSSYFARGVTRRKLLDWYPILPAFKPLMSGVRLPAGVPYRMSYALSLTDEYLNTLLLRFSRFAWTHIRGGPDSMRHYEILSQGTPAYFLDLNACMYKPCLSHLPKGLLSDVTQLPGVRHLGTVSDAESSVRSPYYFRFSRKEILDAPDRKSDFTHVVNFVAAGDVDSDAFDEEEYDQLSKKLLVESRRSLSCASVVKSLFVRAGFAVLDALPRSILFVSFPHTDYITYTVECGLGELGLNYTVNYRYGTAYVDPDEDMMRPIHRHPNFTLRDATGRSFIHHVKQRKTTKNYGLGFATAQKLQFPPNPIPSSQQAMCEQILSGWHDFYIIAWKSRRFLMDSCFEQAMTTLGSDRVVIVDGEDHEYMPNLTEFSARGVRIFSREARCDLFE